MEHIAAILMLVACGENDTACRELPVSSVAYETVEECQSFLQLSLQTSASGNAALYGQCVEVDPAL